MTDLISPNPLLCWVYQHPIDTDYWMYMTYGPPATVNPYSDYLVIRCSGHPGNVGLTIALERGSAALNEYNLRHSTKE